VRENEQNRIGRREFQEIVIAIVRGNKQNGNYGRRNDGKRKEKLN